MNITRFGKGYALMVNKNVYCLEQSLVEPSSLNLSALPEFPWYAQI